MQIFKNIYFKEKRYACSNSNYIMLYVSTQPTALLSCESEPQASPNEWLYD